MRLSGLAGICSSSVEGKAILAAATAAGADIAEAATSGAAGTYGKTFYL